MHPFLKRIPSLAATAARCGWIAVAALWLQPALAADKAAAQPLAIVTIVDGPARLLRDEQRLRVDEGLRLQSHDIVETAADSRVTRIEFGDGLAFDLGPATRIWVDPPLQGERGRAARLYLLAGWVKAKAAAGAAGAKPAGNPKALLASPALDVIDSGGSLVASVGGGALALFAEAGTANVQERVDGKPFGTRRSIAAGQFFERSAQGRSAVAERPTPDFVGRMPRSFVDTLPDRARLFSNRSEPPKPVGRIGYADAVDWLAAEPGLRRPAMNRWRPLTRDPEFRKALVANMNAHPEWDRLLFPEKYQPRQ